MYFYFPPGPEKLRQTGDVKRHETHETRDTGELLPGQAKAPLGTVLSPDLLSGKLFCVHIAGESGPTGFSAPR